jgi:excinuclease ABC subunit A
VVGAAGPVAYHAQSITGQYLSGRRAIPYPRRSMDGRGLVRLMGASGNNLKDIDVAFPTGLVSCVTGVSGSGKSTLVNDTLYRIAARRFHHAGEDPKPHRGIEGLEWLDKVVDINQSPIGRTPRSNPATYTGLFTPIRDLFAATPEARSRGYAPGRFSFNVRGGRCEACQGDGVIKVEMHFLPDVYVTCDLCQGARYNRETLDIHYKGLSIAEVLCLSVEDARHLFDPVPAVASKLQTLIDVGLAYIKLARELSRRDTGSTLYVLDEPTTGLHFHDIEQLLSVLQRLCERGNTVIVIEHNLEVIKTADWVVDLGPEGGEGGGEVVATGTPEEVAAHPRSYTGRFLAPVLARQGAGAPEEHRRLARLG